MRNTFIRFSKNQYRLNIFELMRVFVVVIVFSSASLVCASLSFATIRIIFPMLYRFPLLPIILRPFTGHFVRGSLTLLLPFSHIGLLFRAWFISFTTMFVWEISELLFDVLIPQVCTIDFCASESNSHTCLAYQSIAPYQRLIRRFDFRTVIPR